MFRRVAPCGSTPPKPCEPIDQSDIDVRRACIRCIRRRLQRRRVSRGATEFRDELFGAFVVNDSLSRIVATLGDFPTARWHDYHVWVDSVTPDSVIVRGRGDTYGDQPSRHVQSL